MEEARITSQRLEAELEKKQLEAQDGWAAAAQLQQCFTNLHNVLRSSSDEGELTDEPSELATLVNSGIVSLKDEYEKLQIANARNKEMINELSSNAWCDLDREKRDSSVVVLFVFTEQLADIEREQQAKRGTEASKSSSTTSEIGYLKDEISILTLQLRQ